MTEIYIVRHGESLANAAEVYLGHADWDLSETGYVQARNTAERLSGVKFASIYSSDLIRAMHTAQPHAEIRGMHITPCPELREINVGDWEEKKISELRELDEFNVGWKENYGTFCPPNGESVAAAAERVYSAIEKIAKKHDGETVLITMHAAVIRAFWCKILGLSPDLWATRVKFPTNASYSTVQYSGGKFTPLEYSL